MIFGMEKGSRNLNEQHSCSFKFVIGFSIPNIISTPFDLLSPSEILISCSHKEMVINPTFPCIVKVSHAHAGMGKTQIKDYDEFRYKPTLQF